MCIERTFNVCMYLIAGRQLFSEGGDVALKLGVVKRSVEKVT